MARSTLPILLLVLLLLASCGGSHDPSNAPAVLADSIWDGELQVTGPDARFMACGSGIRYALSGPGMDTVMNLYQSQLSFRGQTMKVWLTGHLEEQHAGQRDTAFVVRRIEHIDATLSCPPRPNARIAGRYTITLDEPMGKRTITMDLFPSGQVTSYTLLPDRTRPLEQDGTWGVNSKGEVDVYWPVIDKHAIHGVTENALTIRTPNAPRGTPAYILQRIGEPQRMGGTFGQLVRWMAAVAERSGAELDTNAVALTSPLEELFTTEAVRSALRDSAITWFPLTADQQRVEWPAASSVRDLVGMKRNCDLRDR